VDDRDRRSRESSRASEERRSATPSTKSRASPVKRTTHDPHRPLRGHGKSARGDDSNNTESMSAYSDPSGRSNGPQDPSIDRSSAPRSSSAPDDNWNNTESAYNNRTRGNHLQFPSDTQPSHRRRVSGPEYQTTRPRYNGDINIPHKPGYDETEVLVADSDDDNELWEYEVGGAYDLFRQGWDIPSWGDHSPSVHLHQQKRRIRQLSWTSLIQCTNIGNLMIFPVR